MIDLNSSTDNRTTEHTDGTGRGGRFGTLDSLTEQDLHNINQINALNYTLLEAHLPGKLRVDHYEVEKEETEGQIRNPVSPTMPSIQHPTIPGAAVAHSDPSPKHRHHRTNQSGVPDEHDPQLSTENERKTADLYQNGFEEMDEEKNEIRRKNKKAKETQGEDGNLEEITGIGDDNKEPAADHHHRGWRRPSPLFPQRQSSSPHSSAGPSNAQ